MYKNDTLMQITCIENLEDNATTFDELTKHIKLGRGDVAVREMLSWKGQSDLDPFEYGEILAHACRLNERIVYDDGVNLLAANNEIIVLYQYESIEIKDRLDNDLELGDEVIWVDPEKEARDLNRVWTIFDVQSEELVKIHDIASEAEVNPSELISIKALGL
jgi:hypothetical protein